MAEDRVIDLLASSDSGETYAFDFSVQGSCLVVLVAIIGFEREMPVRGFEREKPALKGSGRRNRSHGTPCISRPARGAGGILRQPPRGAQEGGCYRSSMR